MENFNTYQENVDLSAFVSFCRREGREAVYRKNDYFCRRTQPAAFLGYVERGCIRYSAADDSGRNHTVGFSFEGDFAVDYSSFLKRKPAAIDLMALEETSLTVVTYGQYIEFINRDCDSCLLARRVTEHLLATVYERMLKFYLMSPERRYVDLITRYPYLTERLAAKEIASFVGVTPEALSRIRRRLLEK